MNNYTILCQLNNGCMGCCGRDFLSKEKIEEAIKINTTEFKKADSKVKAQYIKFRDRFHPEDLLFGVCRNLIEESGKIFCPLHPKLHHGVDLRENHCNTKYLCGTAKKFAHWNTKKQSQFLRFIESKKLDNLDYSILMDNSKLLEEFSDNLQ